MDGMSSPWNADQGSQMKQMLEIKVLEKDKDMYNAQGTQDCDSPIFKSDAFRMYCFKILPCSKRFSHDWTVCPFAHPGEKAKRRDPRVVNYTGIACPDMKKNQPCLRGDSCPYAHNIFEYWLHPSRYRSQLCNDGAGCKRKICFFAHQFEELRQPTYKPQQLNQGVDFMEDPFTAQRLPGPLPELQDLAFFDRKDTKSSLTFLPASPVLSTSLLNPLLPTVVAKPQRITSEFLASLAQILIELQELLPGTSHVASLMQAFTSLCQAHHATQLVTSPPLRLQQELQELLIGQQLHSYITKLLVTLRAHQASLLASLTLPGSPAAQLDPKFLSSQTRPFAPALPFETVADLLKPSSVLDPLKASMNVSSSPLGYPNAFALAQCFTPAIDPLQLLANPLLMQQQSAFSNPFLPDLLQACSIPNPSIEDPGSDASESSVLPFVFFDSTDERKSLNQTMSVNSHPVAPALA